MRRRLLLDQDACAALAHYGKLKLLINHRIVVMHDICALLLLFTDNEQA